MLCEYCKREVEEDMEFCPFCGEKIIKKSKERIFCWNCGKEFIKGTAVCDVCGVSLEQGENRDENENIITEEKKQTEKTEPIKEDYSEQEIYIAAEDSGYGFRRTQERYRANGGKMTEAMYGYTMLDFGIIAGMVIIAILVFFLGGGFKPQGVLAVIRVAVFFPLISSFVCACEGKVCDGLNSLKDNEDMGKKIVSVILNMTQEEIELRESRRRRAIVTRV